MKQLWFGALLLIVLLLAGFASSVGIRWVQDPISSQLEQAAAAGFSEDWEQAEALFAAAQARWKTYRTLLSSISDHAPMDKIDGLFEELEIYKQARYPVLFSALCKQLSLLTRTIGEAHRLNWWNLL
jgi:hypothetical protein